MKARPVADAIHHLRPVYWPFLWAHSLTGYLIVRGTEGLETLGLLRAVVAGGIWAVLLGGPAMGLSTLFEATSPPDETPRTPALGWASVILMLAGMVLAPMVGWEFLDVYLLGMIAAVLHAVPPLRMGRTAAAGVLWRALGIGGLTLFSGYAAAGVGLENMLVALRPMAAFFFLAIAGGVLRLRGQAGAGLVVFILSLAAAVACAVFAARASGVHWYGAFLGLPPLAAWALLGWTRVPLGRGTGKPPALFLCAAAWFLADACMASVGMIR